jgi:hypothetical protein
MDGVSVNFLLRGRFLDEATSRASTHAIGCSCRKGRYFAPEFCNIQVAEKLGLEVWCGILDFRDKAAMSAFLGTADERR